MSVWVDDATNADRDTAAGRRVGSRAEQACPVVLTTIAARSQATGRGRPLAASAMEYSLLSMISGDRVPPGVERSGRLHRPRARGLVRHAKHRLDESTQVAEVRLCPVVHGIHTVSSVAQMASFLLRHHQLAALFSNLQTHALARIVSYSAPPPLHIRGQVTQLAGSQSCLSLDPGCQHTSR